MLLTNGFDSSLWSFAIPISATDGSVVDFSGGLVTATFQDTRARDAVIAVASTADGTLTFVPAVGDASAYFVVTLTAAQRNGYVVARPTAVAFDIRWKADPSSSADPTMLGRESIMVHPNAGSSGLTGNSDSPVLIPAQPYGGLVASSPVVVGPQGPVSAVITDALFAMATAFADSSARQIRILTGQV